VTWPTSVSILVFLGLSVLDLGPMYATDRQPSDAHHRLMPPTLGAGNNNGDDKLLRVMLFPGAGLNAATADVRDVLDSVKEIYFIARQHAMHAERDTVMANPSVCPSVCPTLVLCQNEWPYRHIFLTV